MSLYNLLHGQNPFSSVLLKILGIDQLGAKYVSGRFRDIYLNEDATKIILYTRNGGGNRETYQGVFDNLSTHPNYLENYDDEFDSTYAYIVFSVPEEHKVLVKEFMTGEKPETVHEKFLKTMEEMKKMSPEQLKADSRFQPIVKMLDKLGETLNETQTLKDKDASQETKKGPA
jgi:hypothetical protein